MSFRGLIADGLDRCAAALWSLAHHLRPVYVCADKCVCDECQPQEWADEPSSSVFPDSPFGF